MIAEPQRLRILATPTFPLRVGERIWDDHVQTFLDAVDVPAYRSAMNQPADTAAPDRDATLVEGGATLFTLLDVADRLYGSIAEALGRVGLSYAKFEVLKFLRDANEAVNLSTLAQGQGCARSNITQLVDRLESEGLVNREQDPEDRRGVRAALTSQGADLVDEGVTQIDVVRAQFAASFTAPERAELARLLAKIR
jgi:DNA-binding MarR family transcriptional regulator